MTDQCDPYVSSLNLRAGTFRSGIDGHVKVNQRKLIDKILARYSSDFVVFRELMQNADDVRAKSFHSSVSCRVLDSSCDHSKSTDNLRRTPNEAWASLDQSLRSP
jgi:hypothetical protein